MDWIKAGWGPKLNSEFNHLLSYYIDISKMALPSSDPISTAVNTVNQISKTHSGPYYLMVSGGVDSQCMMWAWLQSGVPFTAVACKYVSHDSNTIMNAHDLVELELFTSKFNIPVSYKNYDVFSFLENELQHYAVTYQCTSPQICSYMKMSELLEDGTVIFSGNFGNEIELYNYTIFGLHRYAEQSGRSIIPFFLMHDKNIAGCLTTKISADRPEIIAEFIGNEFDARRYLAYRNKIEILKYNGFPIFPQKTKYTGFEKIKEHYETQEELVIPRERLKYSNNASTRIFDIVFRYRLSDIVKYKDNIEWIK